MARWVGLVKIGVWVRLEGVVEVDVEVDRSAEGENMAAITAGLVAICEDRVNAMLCYAMVFFRPQVWCSFPPLILSDMFKISAHPISTC